jgi:hypothetical protein
MYLENVLLFQNYSSLRKVTKLTNISQIFVKMRTKLDFLLNRIVPYVQGLIKDILSLIYH